MLPRLVSGHRPKCDVCKGKLAMATSLCHDDDRREALDANGGLAVAMTYVYFVIPVPEEWNIIDPPV